MPPRFVSGYRVIAAQTRAVRRLVRSVGWFDSVGRFCPLLCRFRVGRSEFWGRFCRSVSRRVGRSVGLASLGYSPHCCNEYEPAPPACRSCAARVLLGRRSLGCLGGSCLRGFHRTASIEFRMGCQLGVRIGDTFDICSTRLPHKPNSCSMCVRHKFGTNSTDIGRSMQTRHASGSKQARHTFDTNPTCARDTSSIIPTHVRHTFDINSASGDQHLFPAFYT